MGLEEYGGSEMPLFWNDVRVNLKYTTTYTPET